jgi:hypothetical protein
VARTFRTDSIVGAFSYIQGLLGYLNGNTQFASGAQDPFSTVIPAQANAFQADSSVIPTVNDKSDNPSPEGDGSGNGL